MKVAAMSVAVVLAVVSGPAAAAPRKTLSGTVRSLLGAPLKDAVVTDGSASATTDAAGVYTLLVDPALVNTLHASKSGYATVTRTIVPLAETGAVDFDLPFKITPTLSPGVFDSVPKTVTYTAKSRMPASHCMIATDDRTGGGQTMEMLGTDAEGVTTWAGGVTLPPTASPGNYRITFTGRTCGTLTVLTDQPQAGYLYDRTAPTIGVVTPAEGRTTVGVLPLPSRDGRTRVFGPVMVQVDAMDDVGLALGRIDVSPAVPVTGGCGQEGRGATAHRYVCGPFVFLVPGAAHTLTVRVSDLAGKTSTLTMELLVPGGRGGN